MSKIIFEQHGAGSGKTHNALLNIAKLCEKGKCIFTFLSKTHAALGNIREKIETEMANKVLGFENVLNIELILESSEKWPCFYVKYKSSHAIIICGTLDSFVHSLIERWPPFNDYQQSFFIFKLRSNC